MKIKIVFSLIFLSGILLSCDKNEQVGCTLEFRTIGVTVTGDSLTDFYTLRIPNSDTIRLSAIGFYPYKKWYPVLDDNYQSKIANTQESFRFIGKINDTIVVNETFIIKADACHIEKVSGRSEVGL